MSESFDPEALRQASKDWAPETRSAMLAHLRAAAAREELQGRYSSAAELAQAVDPTFKITPAIQMIAEAIEVVLDRPRHNLLVTCPPQEGKSTLCAIWAPLRALQLDSSKKIILATYASGLAEDHSRACRDIITRHGSGVVDELTGMVVEDKLGYQLSPGANKVNSWKLANVRGGMIAVGLEGGATGKSADLLIIDDPYKNMAEADSVTHRRKVDEWMSSVARTRLSPQASMIVVQTRWHPEDLSGKILAGEAVLEPKYRTWKHINIPAIAEAGLPDALGRAPGEVMESARGRTKEEFEATRRAVGERVWFALYQGSPVIPSGGLFMREWFDPHLPEAPASPVAAVVGIDPADTGQGDDTGIIGATLAQDGTIAMIEDWSGKFTADEWSRQAILLALTIGAREIALEAYAAATTYVQVLKRAWRDIHTEAVAKRESGATLTPAEERACAVNMPFTIHKWRARGTGDPVGRSALLRQALETGKCRVVETKMIRLENDAADWQEGQHQPDRVSAAIVAHDRLAELASGRITLAPPVSRASGTAPAWLSRKIG